MEELENTLIAKCSTEQFIASSNDQYVVLIETLKTSLQHRYKEHILTAQQLYCDGENLPDARKVPMQLVTESDPDRGTNQYYSSCWNDNVSHIRSCSGKIARSGAECKAKQVSVCHGKV